MIAIEQLYILDVVAFTEHIYRMGNATWPAFTEDRARKDLHIQHTDRGDVVAANGNGFSAFNYITDSMRKPGQKVWRINRGRPFAGGARAGRRPAPRP